MTRAEKEDLARKLFYALDQRNLLCGAWCGMSFADLPDEVYEEFLAMAQEAVEPVNN